jgi:polyadenylate-binding protein
MMSLAPEINNEAAVAVAKAEGNTNTMTAATTLSGMMGGVGIPSVATAGVGGVPPPQAAVAAAMAAPPFHSASLYVGDLAPDVNEGLLFEIFNAVGPVASIRVCRDAVTRRSLGYAYINFHQVADAERALDTMNYSDIKGQPCRIMWSQRDPSLRRSNVGNIFVKNLHPSIDNKQLYDTFSLFGNILSCKVVTDPETNESKGYGYVHYETAEAASAAIEKLDGMLIDGQEVQVGHFVRRTERPGLNEWTNCFVKNIPLEWTDEKLREVFTPCGEILSATIVMGNPKDSKRAMAKAEEGLEDDEDSKKEPESTDVVEGAKEQTEGSATTVANSSLGFGFVNFAEHDFAAKAVEELNGKKFHSVVDGKEIEMELYVGRAQKKSERERELRSKFEALKMERISKFQGINLYVKNLDDSITDDSLREEFSPFGTITSCRVMRDPKDSRSRGFGFVCFSAPEEAARAVNEMNGKLIAQKPIFVALAQRKDVRRAQLEAQHSATGHVAAGPQGGVGGPGAANMMRAGGPMGGTAPMGYPGMMPMYMQRPGGSMQPAYPMMPQMLAAGQPRGGAGVVGAQQPQPGARGAAGGYGPLLHQQQQRPVYPMPGYGVVPGQPGRGGGMRGPPPPQQGRGGQHPQQAGRGPQGGVRAPVSGRGGQVPGRGMPSGATAGGASNQLKFNQQARNSGNASGQPQPAGNMSQQSLGSQPEAALTASALASATPEMQKNMIGERLYPLIHASQPELAGKITGMLLEMDNSELLHLLESPEALNSKINEALLVLEAHNASQMGRE